MDSTEWQQPFPDELDGLASILCPPFCWLCALCLLPVTVRLGLLPLLNIGPLPLLGTFLSSFKPGDWGSGSISYPTRL